MIWMRKEKAEEVPVETVLPRLRELNHDLDENRRTGAQSACRECFETVDQAVHAVERDDRAGALGLLRRLKVCMDTCVLLQVGHNGSKSVEGSG
jgi:hypothetical protein